MTLSDAKVRRYAIGRGVSLSVIIEGNWLDMPVEKLKLLFEIADRFEAFEKQLNSEIDAEKYTASLRG